MTGYVGLGRDEGGYLKKQTAAALALGAAYGGIKIKDNTCDVRGLASESKDSPLAAGGLEY